MIYIFLTKIKQYLSVITADVGIIGKNIWNY